MRLGLLLCFAATVGSHRDLVGQATGTSPDSVTVAARQLLGLIGAGEAALTVMESQLSTQKAAMPQVPAEFWTEFLTLARRDLPKLIDAMIPIYASHFSLEEIRGLIAFYQTPLGRRLASTQPALAKEGADAGARWGAQLGEEAARNLQKSGKPPE